MGIKTCSSPCILIETKMESIDDLIALGVLAYFVAFLRAKPLVQFPLVCPAGQVEGRFNRCSSLEPRAFKRTHSLGRIYRQVKFWSQNNFDDHFLLILIRNILVVD